MDKQLSEADIKKLIAAYERLCPNDPIEKDDPRRGAIAREMYDIGRAKTLKHAAGVIQFWGMPDEETMAFVRSARSSFSKMKLEAGRG